MPLVNIQVVYGAFTMDQKASMISKIVAAMVSIEDPAALPVTWVRIQEIEHGDWAFGGRPPDIPGFTAMPENP